MAVWANALAVESMQWIILAICLSSLLGIKESWAKAKTSPQLWLMGGFLAYLLFATTQAPLFGCGFWGCGLAAIGWVFWLGMGLLYIWALGGDPLRLWEVLRGVVYGAIGVAILAVVESMVLPGWTLASLDMGSATTVFGYRGYSAIFLCLAAALAIGLRMPSWVVMVLFIGAGACGSRLTLLALPVFVFFLWPKWYLALPLLLASLLSNNVLPNPAAIRSIDNSNPTSFRQQQVELGLEVIKVNHFGLIGLGPNALFRGQWEVYQEKAYPSYNAPQGSLTYTPNDPNGPLQIAGQNIYQNQKQYIGTDQAVTHLYPLDSYMQFGLLGSLLYLAWLWLGILRSKNRALWLFGGVYLATAFTWFESAFNLPLLVLVAAIALRSGQTPVEGKWTGQTPVEPKSSNQTPVEAK